MTISTITIGGVDYTAYASVAEADSYLAVDPSRATPWAALSTDLKGAHLVAATRRLDLLPWSGEKQGGASQEEAWPRTGASYVGGTSVADGALPHEVERATMLLAGTLASDAAAAEATNSSGNTRRVKAGSAEVEFFKPGVGRRVLKDETSLALVLPLLANATGGVGSLSSGTDGETSFADSAYADLNQGYS